MPRTLAGRLAPLLVAMGLQGMILWVPVEKLFMSQIGFTPASVGVMAAAYAAVVPLLEVPSGILADRWSRNGTMVLACVGLLVSSTIGGLSHNVATYVVAAMVLGVYFALSSGTVDSIVYDTVLEETGSSDLYETWIGRVRIVESVGFVVSALAGGVLAEATSARPAYFVTLPFAAAAIIAFLRFDEPRLHRDVEPTSLRSHIALTVRTILRRPEVLRVVLLLALVGMLAQAVFEFGPLWLVALAAPAVLFGPYWAALMSTLGVGGYLAAKLDLTRTPIVVALAVVTPAATVVLALTRSLAAVVIAQTVLALLLAVVAIHAGRLLHDAVPSAIRAGVSSGAGTASWVLFLPFALALGWVGREQGVPRAPRAGAEVDDLVRARRAEQLCQLRRHAVVGPHAVEHDAQVVDLATAQQRGQPRLVEKFEELEAGEQGHREEDKADSRFQSLNTEVEAAAAKRGTL